MTTANRFILLSPILTPSALFRSGEQGAWYDPSDLTSMFQDSAGTTPAAVDQPVGKILDKSGRGNHASQATAGNRPTLKQDASGNYYLLCDGSLSGMATTSIDFSATDKLTLWAGVTKSSDAAAAIIAEFSANFTTNAASFYLSGPDSNGTTTFGSASRGNAIANANQASAPTGYAAPSSAVLATTHDIAGALTTLRVNGVVGTNGTGTKGTGNFGNYPLYLFRRGGTTLPFNGRCYGLIVRGAASNPRQIAQIERWLGRKQGIAL